MPSGNLRVPFQKKLDWKDARKFLLPPLANQNPPLPINEVKEISHQHVFALCVWSACFPRLP